MPNHIYKINKGINQPVYFKGLRAQYIWYLGGGLAGLLILFAILYIAGINSFICLGLIFTAGAFFCVHVYKLSNTYGEFGMMKKMAKRNIPKTIKSYNRKLFLNLNTK
jgi:hypothetical protein